MNILRLSAWLYVLGFVYSVHCLGRPVDFPPIEELWAKADLVAVIMPVATTPAPDQLTSAGPKYGPRDPKDYQGLNTRCEVVLVMKKSEGLQGWRSNDLTILHFRYAPTVPEFNGGMFIYFDLPPAELRVFVDDDLKRPISRDTRPTYLAFLRRGPDARFSAVTGDYDSETSFRILATPLGGAGRYYVEGGRQNQQRKARQDGAAKGGNLIYSDTNRTSSAPGSGH